MKTIETYTTIEQKNNQLESYYLYLYTPMCGTCQVATSFIDLAIKTTNQENVFMFNMQYLHENSTKWKITSVPCLVYIDKGQVTDSLYAFESVTKVYQFLTQKR